jgi:hypothetical protein
MGKMPKSRTVLLIVHETDDGAHPSRVVQQSGSTQARIALLISPDAAEMRD